MLNQKFKKLFLFLILYSSGSKAGPPFITDDPYPVDHKHWELYFFSETNKTDDQFEWTVPAAEINYGLSPHVELSAIIPFLYNKPYRDESNAYGPTDWELELKYAFIEESQYVPEVAFNPSYNIPLGDKDRGLGNGEGWWEFPIWAGKTWDKWEVYGGGGYAKNRAEDERNFFFGGLAIQRQVTDQLMLGGEIYTQGADANDAKPFTLINVGGSYNFTKKVALLLSIGHSIEGEEQFVSYLALGLYL